MRAVVCKALGDPLTPLGGGVLELVDDAPPPPSPLPKDCVRIQVAAASLNFPDALQIKGQYQSRPKLPFIPGNEVAGVVTEVAPGTNSLAVGDAVCAVTELGAFAEQVVVPAAAAWRVPTGFDVATAAALPIAYGTADLALRHRADLQRGQSLLVLGASGGVGVAAVQIGKIVGARVVAVTRGADKAAFLARLGADAVVDTATLPLAAAAAAGGGSASAQQQPDAAALAKALKAAAGPKGGFDVVFDPVGGIYLGAALKAVAWGAQLLVIGFASGSIPTVAANLLLVKNATVHGIFWGSYMARQPATLRASMDQVLAWASLGALQVPVSHALPLESVVDAFGVLARREVKGKALLLMTPGGGAGPASRL